MAKKKSKKPAAKKAATKRAAPKAAKKPAARLAKAKPVPIVRTSVRQKAYSREELDRFKEIILEKRKEILEELDSLKSTMMDVTTGQYETENSTYSLHMEQGTDAMEREKTFLFASREGKFLSYLNDALKRIERGDYGYCTECGAIIDKERLEAVPHAQQCVKCKMKKK